MSLPENFSVSQARSFEVCPMQYRLRYLTDVQPPSVTDEARDFGRAVHAGLAAGYRFLATVQDVEPADDGDGHLVTSYPINLMRSVALDALEDRWYAEGLGTGDSLDEAREHVLAEFDDDHLAELALRWRVVGVEKRFKTTIGRTDRPGHKPPSIPIITVVDLLLLSKRAPVLLVVDHKTGDRIASVEDIKTNLQLGTYVATVQPAYPDHNVIAGLNYTGQAPGQRLVTGRIDDDDLAAVLGRLGRTYDRVLDAAAEMAFPARPGAVCTWCDYNAVCPASVGLEIVR